MIISSSTPRVLASPRKACAHEHHAADPVDSVSPGVTPVAGGPRLSAGQAAALTADLACRAAASGTFGVGGVLLGVNHEVLATSRNCVVDGTTVQDPTAHGERQLIDWYFGQKAKGVHLPPPEQLTLVTSLDPCAMCAGAILASGMKVAVLAHDTFAGINASCPPSLAPAKEERFGYLGIEGGRLYAGHGPFEGARVPAAVEERSASVFGESLEVVKAKINSVDVDRFTETPAVRALLQRYDEWALTVRTTPGRPGVELAPVLLAKARASEAAGNAYDAASLVDGEGRVLLTVGGQESVSPTRTAFMELTRTWARVRAEDPSLPAFKHCSVVSLQGPTSEATTLMEMGAYGSSVEGPVPAGVSWQYVLPRQSEAATQEMVAHLPPLYREVVRPDIRPVEDGALRAACS